MLTMYLWNDQLSINYRKLDALSMVKYYLNLINIRASPFATWRYTAISQTSAAQRFQLIRWMSEYFSLINLSWIPMLVFWVNAMGSPNSTTRFWPARQCHPKSVAHFPSVLVPDDQIQFSSKSGKAGGWQACPGLRLAEPTPRRARLAAFQGQDLSLLLWKRSNKVDRVARSGPGRGKNAFFCKKTPANIRVHNLYI